MSKVEWSFIELYDDYSVSNEGHIRDDLTGNIVEESINNDGYSIVELKRKGRKYIERVDYLVCTAFLNRDNTPRANYTGTKRHKH